MRAGLRCVSLGVAILLLAAAGAFGASLIAAGNEAATKGDLDRAINLYTEAIRQNPNEVKAYCNRGITYANKGRHDLAIADYTTAVRIDPKSPARWTDLSAKPEESDIEFF